MGAVTLKIDDKEVNAKEGMTVLEAALSAGIAIPTLCHHEKLKPYTACRICTVEIEKKGRINLDTACSCPVEDNLVVRTKSENVINIRRTILELMLAHAPDAPVLQALTTEYGADKNRFGKEPSFCILCGLCVRYCAEIKKKNAVTFVDRGTTREIVFVPEIASKECDSCKECFSLCPTSALQSAFVLAEAFAFPQISQASAADK
ncbi:MAG: 2Fe-2S iron-sulfur cluster-binding protein [Syntrophales bacterium]